ncbi:GDP-L-fucose synthetase [Trypanosoma rangeli]|uniref:GDP-L-fucose synthase n=1 Tax=Trypanosoma rangeli TaxID=5698 RepID=A0A3R7RJU2_TRYRA|nr:GDP-L-fucose synthetase [Trypanosoma rangeli]RNF05631.1 GDP-L-fucose synthetase [Trypanosoma rangeli]|eukprot:RNF05631.1 GDP-L-fucose synthetase [Trypanosoma rangeli]
MSANVVLVTGGSGLVGKALEAVHGRKPCAGETWVFLSSRDADLTSVEATKAVFEKHRPHYVIHLAAKVGGLFKNMRQPVEMWLENVAINNNVLECCRIFKVKKLVSCLSTCIFPDKTTYPINEDMLHNGPPHCSNEAYAYAKRMMEVMNRAYRNEYGCNFTCVIPTNVYGPHDNYDLQNSHVVPGLIHRFYLAKKEGNPTTVMGTGKPLRQFIYSEDLAELMIWVMREYAEESPVILSVDESDEVSIADVAKMVAEAIDYKGEIIFDSSKADGQYRKTADNSKLRKYMPEYKFTPMKEGIKRSVEWFVQNYDRARK